MAPACVPAFALHPPPEAAAVGKKGPVQITLRLLKTTVQVKKSLWFQLELKNIGKEKLRVPDRIFRDMWQLYRNCYDQDQTYIEVQAVRSADGKPIKDASPKPYLRSEGPPPVFYPHYEYLGGPDDPALGKQVNDRLDKLEAQWTKEGLSELQKKVKRHDFWSDWNRELRNEEDRAKSFWLAPGASTATYAWTYPGPYHINDVEEDLGPIRDAKASGDTTHDPDGLLAEYDIEKQVDNYAQLWFFQFEKPGRYKVRAVYDWDVGYDRQRLARSPGYIRVRTPYIEFEVLP